MQYAPSCKRREGVWNVHVIPDLLAGTRVSNTFSKTTLRPCDHYGDGLQADVGFSVLCTVWLKKRTNSVVPALEKYFPF